MGKDPLSKPNASAPSSEEELEGNRRGSKFANPWRTDREVYGSILMTSVPPEGETQTQPMYEFHSLPYITR